MRDPGNKVGCTAAVESVYLVCADPIVLTRLIHAVIDICFRGWIKIIIELACKSKNENDVFFSSPVPLIIK